MSACRSAVCAARGLHRPGFGSKLGLRASGSNYGLRVSTIPPPPLVVVAASSRRASIETSSATSISTAWSQQSPSLSVQLATMGTPERRREAIFLAGMPGSGKTRVIEQRYGHRLVGMPGGSLTDAERAYRLWDSSEGSCSDGEARTAILDLDREMVEHPLYAPEDPAAVYNVEGAYDWADLRVEERFRKALADPSVGRIILDGTGTKVARRKGRMAAARAAGFRVKILYVRVTLETAKRRNLRRHRVVPLETLRRYEERLTEAVRMSGVDADEVEILDNDVDVHVGDVDATPAEPSKP